MGGVRAYHVPHMLLDGLGPAYSPATVWSAAVVTSLLLPVAHLLVQAYQRLGLALVDDEFSAIHMCWPYHQPNPPTTLTLAVPTLPHGLVATVPGEGTLSRGLQTAELLPPHAPVGSGGRTPGQISTRTLLCAVLSDRSTRDLVSHPCHQGQSELGDHHNTGRSAFGECRLLAGSVRALRVVPGPGGRRGRDPRAVPEIDQAAPVPPSSAPSSSSASWGPKGSPAPSSLRR